MYGAEFYNETTRRYVAVFGTHFNDIIISRKDNDDNTIQRMKVPINYGPAQKFLTRITQDPSLNASPAMTLPRMSFELLGMTYDPERKLSTLTSTYTVSSANGTAQQVFTPVPYDLEFQLTIMSKFDEDGMKIIEQIVPYFTPDVTPTVKLLDDLDLYLDIPIILNSISHEDSYEGSYEERRAILWTLTFTMKAYYFGPVSTSKIIKFATVNLYDDIYANTALEKVTVQPGLTANGEPTTNIADTISYLDINEDDSWAYIVQIQDGDA